MSKAAELANLIGNINAGGGGVNRNVIINGAMNVAVRGTSSTGIGGASGYFTCDRWLIAQSGDGRLTMTQDSSVPTGKGFANSIKLDCTTADTSIASSEFLQIVQKIEGQNLQSIGKGTSDAKPITVSFYVKANAAFNFVCELNDLDNTRHISKLFSTTTDWVKHEITFPADTTGAFDDDNAASLNLTFWLHAGSTYSSGTLNTASFASRTDANRAAGVSSFYSSTDNNFFITGVQLEVGQNPTSFEHEPFATTLLKCQRYFHAVSGAGHPFPIDSAYARYITHSQDTNGTKWFYEYPVEMRAIPTLELNNISSSTVQHYNYNAGASYNMTGSSLSESGTRHAHISFTFASGISTGNTVSWRWLNNPNASWNFKAEL